MKNNRSLSDTAIKLKNLRKTFALKLSPDGEGWGEEKSNKLFSP